MRESIRNMLIAVETQYLGLQSSANGGTIITGAPRSGTTLALRVVCPDLTKDEEMDGSAINEPQPLSNLIVTGQLMSAIRQLPGALQNRCHLIKSPHIGLIMPYLKDVYDVVVVFRDLRLSLPSLFRHERAKQMILCDSKFASCVNPRARGLPDNPVCRAADVYAELYKLIACYRGTMTLLNYGFWNEWPSEGLATCNLYGRSGETSEKVLADIANGSIYSDASFSLDAWSAFCHEFKVTESQCKHVYDANEAISASFRARGLTVRLLEGL